MLLTDLLLVAQEWYYPQLLMKKMPTDLFIGQSDGGNSLFEVPLLTWTVAQVKLTLDIEVFLAV